MRRIGLLVLCFLVPAASLAQPAAEQPKLVIDSGGHSGIVRAVAFTPDGRFAVTTSMDKTIRIWDLASGETIRVIRLPIGPGFEGSIAALAVSPDGKSLAVAGVPYGNGKLGALIHLVALESGRVEKVFKGHQQIVTRLAFSPDGKRLASASNDKTVRVYDLKTGQTDRVLEGHAEDVTDIAFAPDNKRLASVARVGRIWSLATGKPEATLQEGNHPASCVAWSPDGKTIATGNLDGTICLWNPDGKPRQTLTGLRKRTGSISFTADGRELLTTGIIEPGAADAGATLVDVATGKERVRFKEHNNTVMHGSLSRDGKLAITCGGNDNETYIWRTADGTVVHKLVGKGRTIWGVGWSADGKSIVFGQTAPSAAKGMQVFLDRAFHLGELDFRDPRVKSHLSQDRRGTLTLEAKNDITLAIKDGNRMVNEFSYGKEILRSFTWLADGRVVVGNDASLLLIDPQTKKIVRNFFGHSGPVWSVAPSPDGRLFLTGSMDQTIRIWDPERDRPLLSLFVADQDWIAWTEEGLYAASANGERLIGWQVNNGADQAASYFPAAQFRKSLYQPEVIKQVAAAGSVDKALALAGKKPGDVLSVAQVLPPSVTITSPAGLGTIRIPQQKFEVKATAKSSGQHAVTALRLLVDGRPYKGQAGVKTIAAPRLGETQASWQVELTPGIHHLAVLAESAVSRSLSSFTEVTVAGATPGNEQPSLYVLAVGINDYPGGMELKYAAPDADAITQVFQEQGKKAFRAVEVKLVKDKQATKKEIEQGLAWLGSKMTSQDVGVLFFSGHGSQDRAGNFYLVPADVSSKDLAGTCVSGDYLKKSLGDMPGRVIAILDACHSGAAGETRRRRDRALADDLVRDLISEDYGIVVLSSSLGTEYSMEHPSIKHGFFTLALVEGLSGKADFNGDGLIHLTELDAYAGPRVKALTQGMQNPVMAKPATIRSFPLAKP